MKIKLTSLILAVLMVASLIPFGMVASFAAEEADAATEWYTAQTTDSTPDVLEIKNEAELLAFAGVIAKGDGTEFDNKTINLMADIIMNAGWDAFASNVTAPAVQWPNTTGKYFAGTFNGNGHVISGAYLKGTGQYVGLFGNINTDQTAVVENLIIVNSYITGPQQGVGTIFGGMNEPTWDKAQTAETEKQEAIMRNLYVNTNVVGTGDGNVNLGQGGLIGGNRAYITVENAVVAGRVVGGVRGVGGICGQSRGHCKDSYWDPNNDNTKDALLPTTAKLTVKNVLITAELLGGNKGNSQSFVGGIIGYMNNASDKADFDNVIINARFGTNLPADAKSGQYNAGTLWYTGYVYGGAWGAKNYNEDGVLIYQEWWVDNVFYVASEKLVQGHYPVNKVVTDAKWYFDGATEALSLVVDKANPNFIAPTAENGAIRTDDGNANKAMGGNYNMVGGDKSKLNNKYIYKEWYDNDGNRVMVDEIGADGKTPTGNKVPGWYEPNANDIIKEKLPATSVDKLTGEAAQTLLTTEGMAQDWVTTAGMPMPKTVAEMIDGLEITDSQSATPTPDADWYANEIADATPNDLCIYNADDLLGFAAAINAGTDFAGKTVTLFTNITLNEGWDAFATTVTVPTTTWPLTTAHKSFAGTFDGNGLTISGIYLDGGTSEYVGIFGNVYSNKIATVKNVAIKNSYVTSKNQALGGLFGVVHGETIKGPVETNNGFVGKTSAVIDNVYANINVFGNSNGSGNFGQAGFIGATCADAKITNSVFDGVVNGGRRGLAAFIGAIRPAGVLDGTDNDNSYTSATPYQDMYKPNIVIENCLAMGSINVLAGGYGFAGAVAGYVNSFTPVITIKNFVSTMEITQADDAATNKYLGAIIGGTWAKSGNIGTTLTDVRVNANWDNVYFTTKIVAWKNNPANPIYTINGTKIDSATINTVLAATDAANLKGAAAMGLGLEGWTATVDGMMPTSIYNMTYTGYVGTSVAVNRDLSLNVYYKVPAVPQLVATVKGPDDAEAKEIKSKIVEGDIHVFTISGIALDKMTDEYTFTYGDKVMTLSVKNYLVDLLKVDKATATAMLNLGAAAQTAAGATTGLVTDGLTLDAVADNTASITSTKTTTGTESKDYFIKKVELLVEDGEFKIRVEYKCYDMGGQQNVKVTIGDRESRLTYQDANAAEKGRTYYAIFNDFDVTDMNEVITMVVNETSSADSPVLSQSVSFDLSYLVKEYVENTENAAADIALVKALYAVATSLN